MSLALRCLVWAMRRLVKPILAATQHAKAARTGLAFAALAFFAPRGLCWHKSSSAWRVVPRSGGSGQVVLYFHGGGYVAGSPWTHRGLLGRIARESGAQVVAPRYPLAPEYPAPAAFEHGLAAFRHLLASGIDANSIILAGDSAGGGLAAALADALTQQGTRYAGMVLLSPWTDMTLSGDSIARNASKEAMLPAARMSDLVAEVHGNLALTDPRISPLFGTGLTPPPSLILVGQPEILLDDSRRLAESLRARGGQVDLHIEPHAPHVYAFLAPYVPEARRAIAQIGRFIRALSPPPQAES